MKGLNWRLALGVAIAGGYLSGCAQDVPDIDRTGPNKVEKEHFLNDDEWYFRQTVIDTDTIASTGNFESWESNLRRVRWSITEDALIAWSTQDAADGINDGQLEEEGRRVGIVAMFPIKQHFDVERGYSSATGEQSNVIVEAGSDRHWYERKFMRVDWSTNLARSMYWPAGVVGETMLGTMSASSRTVPQQDGYVDPDRTRYLDLDKDRPGIEYLDTVTEYYYQPDILQCYFEYGWDTIFNCEAGTIRMRNSFLKRPQNETYAPMEYLDSAYIDDEDGNKLYTSRVLDFESNNVFLTECDQEAALYMRDRLGYEVDDSCRPATFDFHQRFGYFRTDTVSWDPQYKAAYEEQRLYYANRWNIWQTMLNEDGSIMPMEDRVPKPIIYYTNPEYPADMWPHAQEVAKQWDVAFTNSVMVAQGKTEQQVRDQLMATYGSDKMYEIRWNSCSAEGLTNWFATNGADDADRMDIMELKNKFQTKWGGADLGEAVWNSTHDRRTEFCAKLEYATETRENGGFAWERIGDLRYSFFNWVDEAVPWLGYGPSAADPVTGQIISGNANFAGQHLRTYGPIAADYVQYMNGELEEADLIHGDHIRDYLRDSRDKVHEQRQSLSTDGKREMARRSGRNPADVSPTNFEKRPELTELPLPVMQVGREAIMRDAQRVAEANVKAMASDSRVAEFYDNPELRRIRMADPNYQIMVEARANALFGPDHDEEDMHQAFIDVSTPGLTISRRDKRDRLLGEASIMLADNMERSMESLLTYGGVNEFLRGKSRQEIADYFVGRLFVGTQLHEVGHTVGLRHNFSASMDAMNYHDEYWNIQRAIADGKIEPEDRWSIQGEMAREISGDPNIDYLSEAEFRLASVMDYTGDFTGRFGGLGKYDQAAINFAYAEAIEQFKPDSQLQEEFGGQAQVPNGYDTDLWLSDYTEIPRILAGAVGEGPAQDPAVQNRGINVVTDGRQWVPIKQAINDFRVGVQQNLTNWKNGEFLSGAAKPWQDRTVPYEFCSDEYRGVRLGCDVYDWGSNQREIVNHYFDTYRIMQPRRRYNGGRNYKGYENLSSYYGWVARTLGAADQPFRYYSYYQWWDLGAYTDDLREASIDAINFYAEVLATPNPGRYCRYGDTTGISPYWWFELDDVYVPADWDRERGECTNFIDIGKGVGQFYGYEFTDEYDYRIERVGSFVDKSVATQALFQLNSNYVDSNFFTDFRATNVTYWTLFQDELLAFLRGVIIGDYKGFAGVYNPQSAKYEHPKVVDPKAFGKGIDGDQVGMARVYTPISFGHELDMLIGGMLYNHTWLDRHTNFGQYIKLAVTNDELQPFPDATEIHTFTHPETLQVYSAAQTPNGDSIAVELVGWANELSARLVEAENTLAAAEPNTGAYEDALELVTDRSQQLEEVVAKMDQVRWVYDALGANGLR